MTPVLVVGAGAAWEPAALAVLDQRPDLVVLRRCVDVDDLLAAASAGQAEAAVVGLDAPGFDAAAVDHLRRAAVRPVAVAPAGQLDAGRLRAARIGVRTVVPDDEIATLADVLARPEAPPAPPPAPGAGGGRVVAVWGPAGAPGRTTVAAGLAGALSRRVPTTLVDADPYGGSVAQQLGILDEVSGLLAAARLAGAGELTESVATVQRAVDPSFTVVTGLPRPDRWVEVRPGTVETLVEAVAIGGPVVVDTGFCLEDAPAGLSGLGGRPGRNHLTLGALDVADEVLVVGTADPVGLSRLARGLVDLRELVGSTPVRVVVNRMRASLGWSERELSAMVAGFVTPSGLHFLPEDRPCVDKALVTGRTLHETDPDAPLVTALDQLAAAVVPALPAPTRPHRLLRPRRAGTGRRR